QGRYHMYRNVYFHKVVRSGEGMVRLALRRARRLAAQERLRWPVQEEPGHTALLGRKLAIHGLLDLDDISVLHCFKMWMDGEDLVLSGLCRGLLFRKLFKTIDLTRVDPSQIGATRQEASRAVDATGGASAYRMFYDEPSETPYDGESGEG